MSTTYRISSNVHEHPLPHRSPEISIIISISMSRQSLPRGRWKWLALAASRISTFLPRPNRSTITSTLVRVCHTRRARAAFTALPQPTLSHRVSGGEMTVDPFPPCPPRTGWGLFWVRSAVRRTRRTKTCSGSEAPSRSSTRFVWTNLRVFALFIDGSTGPCGGCTPPDLLKGCPHDPWSHRQLNECRHRGWWRIVGLCVGDKELDINHACFGCLFLMLTDSFIFR